MAYIKRVYCEYRFLVDWLKSKPKVEVTRLDTIQEAKNWLSIGQLLNECDLAFDFTAEEKDRKVQNKDLGFEYLNFRVSRGRGLSFTNKVRFPELESDNPFNNDKERYAYYLTSLADEKCIYLSCKLGTLVLNLSLLLKSNIFRDNGMPIPNKDFFDWSFLNDELILQDYLKYSTNSVIIVDNYLIPSLDRCLDSNIKPIIQKLTENTKNKSEKIEIVIFSFVKDRASGIPCVSNCEKLISTLHAIDEDRIKVKIYEVTGKDFHDRVIVTNCLWFSCGKGFTEPLFGNDDNAKSTSISLLTPFIQTSTRWCNEAYVNLMYDIAKVLNRSYVLNVNMWGDEEDEKFLIKHFKDEVCQEKKRTEPGIRYENKVIRTGDKTIKQVGFIDLSVFANKKHKR